MDEHTQARDPFPTGSGLADDVLADFGIDLDGFVDRMCQILMGDAPPNGLDNADARALLAHVCALVTKR